jgi:thiol-disulfide isomerase/thioredoxin
MMKKLAFLLFAVSIFAACSTKGPKIVEINGKIDNLDATFALLMSKGITDTIHIESDGTFSKSFKISDPTYYTLRAGRISNNIFVLPGDVLTFKLDIKQAADGPTFEGINANINYYLIEVNKTFRAFSQNIPALYSQPKEEFMNDIDSLKILVHEQLTNSGIENKQFIELEKARINYRLLSLTYDYPSYNARISGNQFVYNAEDYEFLNEVSFNNVKHLLISEYASLINKHIQVNYYNAISADEHKGKSDFERNLILFDMVDSLVTDQTIRDYLKQISTLEAVQWSSLEIGKNVAEHYIANVKTDAYKVIVENALAKRMLLAPGQPAPAFTLTDINGQTVSLSDFRGQLVYLDFWASWCGPCRRQIPHLKKMKEAYANKPVAFVMISLDDDKDAWLKAVNDESLTGTMLHAEKAWSSDVAQQYQIKGVPTFVLIDGEGNLIEYNSPRPSDPEASLLIDKHLKSL